MVEFSERLTEAMKLRHMSLTELSDRTGISKSRISCYRNGLYKAKQDAVGVLAKVLKVDEAWLMGYDIDMSDLNSIPDQRNQLFYDMAMEIVDSYVKADKTIRDGINAMLHLDMSENDYEILKDGLRNCRIDPSDYGD